MTTRCKKKKEAHRYLKTAVGENLMYLFGLPGN
jgi:hypothetical protein